MHYQRILDVHTTEVVGAEAIARFLGHLRRVDEWFAAAAAVGAGVGLELRAVRAALAGLEHPDSRQGFLAVNVSPQTACAPALSRVPSGLPLERIVLEIAEDEPVTVYAQIRAFLAPLRAGGMRVAVDDTCAGCASMGHVLALVPALIELDVSLVRDIHTDPASAARAAAVTTLAAATDARVVTEGIET